MTITKLTFDKASNCFETTISSDGNKLSFNLYDFAKADEAKANELANKIINWLATNLEQTKAFAAKVLLETKNSAWVEEEGDAPLSEKEFIEALDLEGITAFSEGNFEVYFDDGDMFWGHLVQVDVAADFSFESADLVG